jgi:predicted DNA-binding ribbon-helix-helix protein
MCAIRGRRAQPHFLKDLETLFGEEKKHTLLANRNVTVGSLSTSLCLEPEFWTALLELSAREKLDIDQLCTMIDGHLDELGRTAGIRVFIAIYYTAAFGCAP